MHDDWFPLALLAVLVVAGTAAVPAAGHGPVAGPAAAVGTSPGATAGPAAPGDGGAVTTGNATGGGTAGQSAPPDPESDVIGWEDGYWYDEAIDVDQSDGLSDAELDRFVARTMARVEEIRGLEFTDDVPVTFVSRDRMRAIARNRTFGEARDDGLYEALFFAGEDTEAADLLARYIGERVVGYAAEEGSDRVVLVTADPDRPAVGPAVLAHELVHVLQDQQFDLERPQFHPPTHDGEFGKDGIVEGDATYVHKRYADRCGADWDCVGAPDGWAAPGERVHAGLARLFYQPYSDGAAYVHRLHERGGWEAVNRVYESPPRSSEQVIHPGGENRTVPVTLRDTARGGWTVQDRERVGEASVFTLFWYQYRRHPDADIGEGFGDAPTAPYDALDYSSVPSAGWGNDSLLVYADGDRHGYVWKTVWDSERDAREFLDAYRNVLRANGGRAVRDGTWRIEDGPFADAFRVRRAGKTVTVVNGPTVATLGEIRPSEGSATPASPNETPPSPTATPRGSPGETNVPIPGFGASLAALALVAAALVARRPR